MKKIVLLFFCFTNLITFGQEKSYEIGLVAGGGFSNAIVAVFPKNPNISYSVLSGISFVYNSNSKFIFETNLSYENKGTSSKVILTDDLGNENGEMLIFMNNSYLTLSALPGFSFGKKTKFFLNSGVVLGVILDKKPGINTKPFKIFDLGIGLKVGIEKPLSDKIKLKLFVQDNFSVLNNLAYNKLNGYMQNAFFVGLGAYYKIGS